MSEFSDNLRKQLENFEPGNLQTYDLLALPPAVRRILRLVLRGDGRTYDELAEEVGKLREEQRISHDQLDIILDMLCEFGWLRRDEQPAGVRYVVNTGAPPKPAEEAPQAGRRALPKDLWETVETRTPKPDLGTRLGRLFRVQPGEAGIVLLMAFLLIANSVALEISEVAGVSGFLSEAGANNILVVWVIDMLLIMLVSAGQSLIVDRFNRRQIVRWMIFAFGVVYILLRLLFAAQGPAWLNYGLLYILADFQRIFFPLVFWILANDAFNIAQTKRLFPLIMAGGFAGQIAGLGLASAVPALAGSINASTNDLLTVVAAIYLVAFVVAVLGLRNLKLREMTPRSQTVREALTEGIGFVREVPAFRYLAIGIVALTVCDTIIEYRFLSVTNLAIADAGRYQIFYSLFRLFTLIITILIQVFVTARLVEKIQIKNAFLIMPVALILGAGWMLGTGWTPGVAVFVSAIGAMLLLRLTRDTVDDSALKEFQGLVPEERRGRVSMFIESYIVAAAVILGAALTGLSIAVGNALGLSDPFALYLAVALLAAGVAVWAILNMRRTYDSSLLNWRLKRRQRGASVLDNIEF